MILRRRGQPSRSKPGGRVVGETRRFVRPGDERPAGAANPFKPEPRRDPVRAAGAVLVRDGLDRGGPSPALRRLVAPQGQARGGRGRRAAALREVLEETGFRASIEADLGTIAYTVRARGRTHPKVGAVLPDACRGRRFDALYEVDRLEWLTPAEAGADDRTTVTASCWRAAALAGS